MSIIVRRTRARDPEVDAELPQTIDVEGVHTLLHQRGEADLAALLLLRLTPEGARELAALLARFRRRWTTPRLFRSYRRLLDAGQARSLDLTVAFLLGAGHAGCRVYCTGHAVQRPDTPRARQPDGEAHDRAEAD